MDHPFLLGLVLVLIKDRVQQSSLAVEYHVEVLLADLNLHIPLEASTCRTDCLSCLNALLIKILLTLRCDHCPVFRLDSLCFGRCFDCCLCLIERRSRSFHESRRMLMLRHERRLRTRGEVPDQTRAMLNRSRCSALMVEATKEAQLRSGTLHDYLRLAMQKTRALSSCMRMQAWH